MLTQKLTKQVVSNYDYPVVETAKGKIRGLVREGLFVFRGIKYANAPRFGMPTPIEAWEGTKPAINYGYACPEMKTPKIDDNYVNPHFWQPQNEDCQYLNIWTPSIDKNAKKTVMFWIHGGGWNTGSSQEHLAYDGENLAMFGDVVVVSVNHRLNCLGYLDLSSFGEKYKNSANVGLADLVAALEWVRDNITDFGGDPDNVMIYGQSGGGSKVSFLMQTPAADGLYHRAGIQSGGTKYGIAPEGWTLKKLSQRLGEITAEELGLDKDNIEKIETIPYYFLAEAVKKAEVRLKEECGVPYRWEPIADNEYCFGCPIPNGFRKETIDIPIIAGTVFGEHNGNMGKNDPGESKNDWGEDEAMRRINEMFGEKGPTLAAEFKRAYPDHPIADLLYIDKNSRKDFRNFVMSRAKVGGKIWNYLFDFESPLNGGTVAWHCAEIPFVFHNASHLEPFFAPGITEKLEDQMSLTWLQFAKTGDPNNESIPHWQAVTPDEVPTMIFGTDTHTVVDHDKAFWTAMAQK